MKGTEAAEQPFAAEKSDRNVELAAYESAGRVRTCDCGGQL